VTRTSLLALALVLGCGCGSSPEPEGATSSADTSALPTALAGKYAFQGQVRPQARLTVDVIDMRMPDAQTRLDDLDAAGAACQLVTSQTYRCTLMHDAGEVATASLDAIATSNKGIALSFGKLRGDPSLTNDAESLKEWDVPQSGSGPLGKFDGYVFRELQGGPDKIILDGTDEYLVDDGDHITRWQEHVISEGRWRFHQDMAVVVLTR
jgi:hypothetical protein